MMKPFSRLVLAVRVLVAIGLGGCGTSGSRPPEFPEIRFTVHPAGATRFKVGSVLAAGVSHPGIVGQEFAITAPFNIILENAAPPYQGTFLRTGSGEITVTLSVISATTSTEVTDVTSAAKDTAVVTSGGTIDPMATPVAPGREVRINVCAPALGAASCFTAGDSGVAAIPFFGTLGDHFDSHLLSGVTPTIYFLEGARESINGVFTRQSFTGDLLLVELYLNGELRQTESGSQDVVVREDL